MSDIKIKANSKVTFNPNIEDVLKKAAMEKIERDGIDIDCPNCGKRIHLLFSGDACKFCGLVINYSIDSNV
jgi:ssDNA-binding Zn-finger/Zn-ribbon topoisomerase 1